MKGIILAGGNGTRLHPITLGVSKQMLPVYDKPMIYYPLSALMLAGITEIEIITTPEDQEMFRRLLGDGSWLGISLTYAEQDKPRGVADAFLVSAEHIGDDSVALVLGDNIFHGYEFGPMLQRAAQDIEGCVLFGYPVRDPERYGVGTVDERGRLVSLEEKPANPQTNMAVTGLYLYDNQVVDIARELRPSDRGELEITDLNRVYMERGEATLIPLGRGFVWLDTGTHDALMEAGDYVQVLEHRQGVRIACLEEIAWRMGYIDREACYRLGSRLAKSAYGQYIMEMAQAG
ncbi:MULTISPECIES: glucose-1-phosphate thymidylyltransferase RfbA [unclassified Streptomyces]|uniref:glucose-1-phosphate thymidylyltransferase RfbA n=1 Tax=unclassified Streptomyces TaxID=2593676 RepID=UPI002251D082|nr:MULTISPECIES: glucose-1-phosphate thymidylyltransferase RfbA [unclassified Streptomyces]MCX4527192.1 glucose-1-phosphate thymidylyltransferase RfbA [Streptomyces sp. NBC_01551]MCX4542232.1 glucose-1-phosphate thymidylyltransferase RfbA [Streptomyces sp. NBC_01565]